ncbi:MAG: hypothetical protein QE263_07330 [Vampirovibrionales bacterium]|nr:hypothetical protein [Vampirovibrionales bacterium]
MGSCPHEERRKNRYLNNINPHTFPQHQGDNPMHVQFANNPHSKKPFGYDSPDVMLDQFLAHLLGDAPLDTYTQTSNNDVKNTAPSAPKADSKAGTVETVQRVFNPAKNSPKIPSIGSAVKIGIGSFIKAALVTPFYFVCRLLGMPKLSFMQRAAVIGGNSVYQGYVKPAFSLNA